MQGTTKHCEELKMYYKYLLLHGVLQYVIPAGRWSITQVWVQLNQFRKWIFFRLSNSERHLE